MTVAWIIWSLVVALAAVMAVVVLVLALVGWPRGGNW